MKKLLLQSAIVALVSTGGFSSVMAKDIIGGYINLTFPFVNIPQTVTAVAANSLNLSFPVKPGLNLTSFNDANKEGAKLNALYDLSSADWAQGCIQLSHINDSVVGGGVDTIEAFNITFNTTALKVNTIQANNIDFLIEYGKCGTPYSSGNFSSLENHLAWSHIGSNFFKDTSDNKPSSKRGDMALYYRIPADSLLALRLKDPATVANKFDFNKVLKFNGQLRLVVTTASQ